MNRIFWLLATLATLALGEARAMQQSAQPPQFTIPWGNSAGPSYIIYPTPTPSQIGVQDCRASLTDGFPPLTFTPSASGGCAPWGGDFNGILKWVTLWNQWQGAGATVQYNSALSAAIGGYPKGALLQSAAIPTCYWLSSSDNNASDPDTGGANWIAACPGGGAGGTSTGTATAQAVTATPFLLRVGSVVTYVAGFNGAGAQTLNVNGGGAKALLKWTCAGLAALQGSEIQAGQIVTVSWDGTEWQLLGAATAFLNVQDQTVCGGANVTSLGLATGNVTIDCGARPLQYIANAGNFTITAPAADGSCMLMVTNGSGAGTITFSGFQVGSSTGDALNTGAGNIFALSIWRINGVSSYLVKEIR